MKRPLRPPKDSKIYKVAMAYVALKAQGLKLQDISDQLGIPKDTISTYVKRANQRGWLSLKSFTDTADRLDVTITDQVIENVSTALSERTGTGTLTSKAHEMTIEAAKGLGVFKSHQAVKVDGAIGVGFALKVQVELPAGVEASSPIQIRAGSVGGTPAIDAEVIGDGEGS